MFGFFSLSFSVGLSIYFVVSNVVGIIQYTLMGRAEWGRLLGREPDEDEDEEPAKATAKSNGKSASGTEASASKNGKKAKAEPAAEEAVPTRPSGRKDKKMRKASSE